MTDDQRISRELPLAAAGGLLLLVLGLFVATARLPEWQAGELRPHDFYAERFRQLAQRAGIQLQPGTPTIDLTIPDSDTARETGEAAKGAGIEHDPTARPGGELRVTVSQDMQEPGRTGPERMLLIQLSPAGVPLDVKLTLPAIQFTSSAMESPAEVERLVPLLLAFGERAGAERRQAMGGVVVYIWPIAGRTEHIFAITAPGGVVEVHRDHGPTKLAADQLPEFSPGKLLLRVGGGMVLFFLAVGLFLVLLSRRRLDLANAALLAAAAAAGSAAGLAQAGLDTGQAINAGVSALLSAIWIALLWAAGESLLRSLDPQFVSTLDTLRLGRIGPRTGRALLFGLALGAGLAGAMLLAAAAAAALPGAWPGAASLALPAFTRSDSVLGQAFGLTGVLLLMLALSARWLPRRLQAGAAGLAAAMLAPPLPLHPWLLQLAVGAVLLGGLTALARRWCGLATLFTAVLAAYLLPLAAFALPRLAWLPGTFAVATGGCLALLVAGLAGLRRPPQVEIEGIRPPAFIRRLEEERRLKYEMDLLARMQRGLLPQRLPVLAGWDVAAHSELATEAGGDLYDFLVDEDGALWVAAGDVAGHGYSCAIAHAMTTAALASLITPERTPAEVLRQVDRVLRRAGARRIFTSLALLRVDLASGSALLGNAGHPFPFLLLMAEGAASEVELPSLPLGQGPAREYLDEPLQLPPGAILVFCSDGLFEAPDLHGDQYGYERPREILTAARQLGAGAILEALLADWRAHLGPGAPPDDTTILVLKHAPPPA